MLRVPLKPINHVAEIPEALARRGLDSTTRIKYRAQKVPSLASLFDNRKTPNKAGRPGRIRPLDPYYGIF